MIRDRLMAQRTGKPVPYTDEEIGSVFLAMIAGLGQGSRSETSPTSS